MIKDLVKMEVSEVDSLLLQATHFNLSFNRSTKYRSVFDSLQTVCNGSVKELWTFITNTARALKCRATALSIPKQFAPYKDNKQGISHSKMVLLLDVLEREGYVDYYRGGLLNMDDADKVQSIYVLKKKYLDLWEGVDVSKEKDSYQFVQIRDKLTKEALSLSGRNGVKEMKDILARYNTLLETTSFYVGGVLVPVQQYSRVFSGSLEEGGRYYNTCGGIQTMKSESRGSLLIDGHPTVELDFKALHPSILYDRAHQCGAITPSTDPYNISLDGIFTVDYAAVEHVNGHNPARNLVKKVLLKALNAADLKAACGSVVEDWYAEHRKGDKGAFYGLQIVNPRGRFPAKELCNRVKDAHPLIAEAFFSGIGLLLQRVDSDIITRVLNSFMDIGVPVLSWHDSCVVSEQYAEMLHAQMLKAYTEVVGSCLHCRIEKKERK